MNLAVRAWQHGKCQSSCSQNIEFEIIWGETVWNLQKTYGNWCSFMLDLSERERGDEGVISLWNYRIDFLVYGGRLCSVG